MQVHRLVIQGRTYEVRSAAEAAHMERVAQTVEQRMDEARQAGAAIPQLAVLAALNLASDLLTERERSRCWRDEARERVRALRHDIDAALDRAARGNR